MLLFAPPHAGAQADTQIWAKIDFDWLVSYLQIDDEWFWPLDDPDERYANKERIRMGLGYRHSSAWRYEGFFVINRTRKSATDKFAAADYVAEMTMKRVW
jgi:hypothetical protein